MRDLAEQVEVELSQLWYLVERRRSLAETTVNRIPTDLEIDALGAFLHSMYNGIELTLKLIAKETGRQFQEGSDSHRQLLLSMLAEPPVLSITMVDKLSDYLAFRHVFRHAYTFTELE